MLKRPSIRIAIGLLCAIAVVVASPLRQNVLAGVGAALVTEGQKLDADVVVLPTEIGAAGALEVATLIEETRAARVLVMRAPAPVSLLREYARRNVTPIDAAELNKQMLIRLGVEPASIDVLSVPQGGTHGESAALVQWCENHGVRGVMIVSSRHHSRRLSRVLRRAVGDRSFSFAVRLAQHDEFDPASWWRDRDSLRVGIVELQKLALDVVLHPLS